MERAMSIKTAQRPLAIGELNRRVHLQSATSVPDGSGGFIAQWQTVATVWARIEPLRGVERYQAAALETVVSWHITIRHRTDIKPSWRIVHGSTVYRIISIVNPDERNRFLQLEVETLQ
jgi:SPP1 family predicted phage head-tail adaptor